jgi:hypothetical protein
MSNPDKGGKFVFLAFQYSYASSNLIKEITKSNRNRSALRPALYLLRHSIELLLKGLHCFRKKDIWDTIS